MSQTRVPGQVKASNKLVDLIDQEIAKQPKVTSAYTEHANKVVQRRKTTRTSLKESDSEFNAYVETIAEQMISKDIMSNIKKLSGLGYTLSVESIDGESLQSAEDIQSAMQADVGDRITLREGKPKGEKVRDMLKGSTKTDLADNIEDLLDDEIARMKEEEENADTSKQVNEDDEDAQSSKVLE